MSRQVTQQFQKPQKKKDESQNSVFEVMNVKEPPTKLTSKQQQMKSISEPTKHFKAFYVLYSNDKESVALIPAFSKQQVVLKQDVFSYNHRQYSPMLFIYVNLVILEQNSLAFLSSGIA
uniref:Uncharacterized protein n=1 Tax=Megaselia scalaris TaxID=36166 RepID=T1GL63_MEGSC